MERYGRQNPSVRPLPRPGLSQTLRPRSVGVDLDNMGRRLANPDTAVLVPAYTDEGVGYALGLATPAILAYGTMIVGVHRNAHNRQFGALTVGHMMGSTVAVSLASLNREQDRTLGELAAGPLAPLFAHANNDTVQTVVHDESEWKEFVAICQRTTPATRDVISAEQLVRLGVDEGRVDAGKRTPHTAAENIAALAYTYLGRSEEALTPDQYDAAYPGAAYPDQRRHRRLHTWPCTSNNAKPYFDLHQGHLLSHKDRAIAHGIADLVYVTVGSDENDLDSDHLAVAVKATFRNRLRVGLNMPAGGRVTCVFVGDLTLLGVPEDGIQRRIQRSRDVVQHVFGPTFPSRTAPRAAKRASERPLRRVSARRVAWPHLPGRECELSRRLRQGEVPVTEQNCKYCFGHDHRRRVCPIMQYRCTDCNLMGHTKELCKLYTREYQFRRFCEHCQNGRFTGVEPRGPLLGAMGFGIQVPFTINQAGHQAIEELQAALKHAHGSLDSVEKEAYRRFVKRAMRPAPLFCRLELPIKKETVTWTDYFRDFDELLQKAPKRLVFRGAICDLIPGRGGASAGPVAPHGDAAPGLEVDTDDVYCERARREAGKAEDAALRRMGGPGDETLNADDWTAARRRTTKRPLGYRDSLTGAPEGAEVVDVTPRAGARGRSIGQREPEDAGAGHSVGGGPSRSGPSRRAYKSTGGSRVCERTTPSTSHRETASRKEPTATQARASVAEGQALDPNAALLAAVRDLREQQAAMGSPNECPHRAAHRGTGLRRDGQYGHRVAPSRSGGAACASAGGRRSAPTHRRPICGRSGSRKKTLTRGSRVGYGPAGGRRG